MASKRSIKSSLLGTEDVLVRDRRALWGQEQGRAEKSKNRNRPHALPISAAFAAVRRAGFAHPRRQVAVGCIVIWTQLFSPSSDEEESVGVASTPRPANHAARHRRANEAQQSLKDGCEQRTWLAPRHGAILPGPEPPPPRREASTMSTVTKDVVVHVFRIEPRAGKVLDLWGPLACCGAGPRAQPRLLPLSSMPSSSSSPHLLALSFLPPSSPLPSPPPRRTNPPLPVAGDRLANCGRGEADASFGETTNRMATSAKWAEYAVGAAPFLMHVMACPGRPTVL